MPRYVWRCSQCGVEAEVSRPFARIEEPPTAEEAPGDDVGDHNYCEHGAWMRLMPRGTIHTHAPGFTGRKGAW